MSEDQDARWQQIVDARVDFSDEGAAAEPMPYDDQVVPLEAAEQNRASRMRDLPSRVRLAPTGCSTRARTYSPYGMPLRCSITRPRMAYPKFE